MKIGEDDILLHLATQVAVGGLELLGGDLAGDLAGIVGVDGLGQLLGTGRVRRVGPGDLQTLEHGRRVGDTSHFGPDGRGGTAADDADVSLLEAVVGAADTQEQEGQEDDGADDQENLKLAQRLKSSYGLRPDKLQNC